MGELEEILSARGIRTGRRHTAGTISVARNSAVVRGVGTNWHMLASTRGLPEMPVAGRIVFEGGQDIYDVHIINSDGLLTLKRPYTGEDLTGIAYVYFEEKTEADLRRQPAEPPTSQPMASPAAAAAVAKPAAPPAERHGAWAELTSGGVGEVVRTVLYALLIALFIRIFLFQPFNIPSGSMIPTLLVGDYLFVSKYAYGYSRHSVPFSPKVFSGRIFGSAPKRGDVIVFKLPSDGHTDYIKRLIGLPGDQIQMIDGVLNINGVPVPRVRLNDFVSQDRDGNVNRTPAYRETLPDGVSYVTLDSDRNSRYDNTDVYVVPRDHYFLMGDNRDNSLDSRVPPDVQNPRHGGVGFVPFENFVGRAEIIFFSTDGSARLWEFWRWIQAARFGRFFHTVQTSD